MVIFRSRYKLIYVLTIYFNFIRGLLLLMVIIVAHELLHLSQLNQPILRRMTFVSQPPRTTQIKRYLYLLSSTCELNCIACENRYFGVFTLTTFTVTTGLFVFTCQKQEIKLELHLMSKVYYQYFLETDN